MAKKSPFISVIIPAYNEEKFLPACLESISKQTLAKNEYEVIVVDNASTDKTAEIAKRYPVKLVQEPRQSVVLARQKGVDESHGEIIVSADADTTYPTMWLERIKFDFINQSKIIAVVGWIYYKNSTTLYNFGVAFNQELNLLIQRVFG